MLRPNKYLDVYLAQISKWPGYNRVVVQNGGYDIVEHDVEVSGY